MRWLIVCAVVGAGYWYLFGMDYQSGSNLRAYSFRGRQDSLIKIRSIEIWRLKPANQGFLEAREHRNWAPDID